MVLNRRRSGGYSGGYRMVAGMSQTEPKAIIHASNCGHHPPEECGGGARARDWNDALLKQHRDRIEALERELAEAVAAERERCARIAERLAQQEAEDFNEQAWAEAIAAAIRTGEAEQ